MMRWLWHHAVCETICRYPSMWSFHVSFDRQWKVCKNCGLEKHQSNTGWGHE
jgi:hypothetical protein